MEDYKSIDNGLLQSALEMIASNPNNKEIWAHLAASPKYGATYTIGHRFSNGICRIDMTLADGSFLPAVMYPGPTGVKELAALLDIE